MFEDIENNDFFYVGSVSIHWKQRDMIWYIAIDDPKLLFFSPNKTRKASCMSDLSDKIKSLERCFKTNLSAN